MLCLHIGLFLLIAFPDLTAGMVFLHLFTFDPAWVVSLQMGIAARRTRRISKIEKVMASFPCSAGILPAL